MMNALDEKAKEMQREYLREWRRKNKHRVREYNHNYWQRKALEKEEEHGANK